MPAGFWAVVGTYYALSVESGPEGYLAAQAIYIVLAMWCGVEYFRVLLSRYGTLFRRNFPVRASLNGNQIVLQCLGADPIRIERDACNLLNRTTGELDMTDGTRIALGPNENPEMARYDEPPLQWLGTWWPGLFEQLETGSPAYLRKYPAGVMCPLFLVLLPSEIITGRAPNAFTMTHVFIVTFWVTTFIALRWWYLRSDWYRQPLLLAPHAD